MVDGLAAASRVDVVYAAPAQHFCTSVAWQPGDTVAEVLTRSQVLTQWPDVHRLPVGIFGRVCEAATPVQPGDRIEFYRPLVDDPKQARRARARREPPLRGRARPG